MNPKSKARWNDLFATIEDGLRHHGGAPWPSTALLRLKQAIATEADAALGLQALQELRVALGGERALNRSLRSRCDRLQAHLWQERDARNDGFPRALHPATDLPASEDRLIERDGIRAHLTRVFSTRGEVPSLAVLRIDLGAPEEIGVSGDKGVADLLRQAAERLGRAVRAEDIVTCTDAEELACLLFDLPSREQLTHLACKMLDLLSQPLQIEAKRIAIRPSIGIAICPVDGGTPDELLRIAKAAQHRARMQESRYAFSNARAETWAKLLHAQSGSVAARCA